MSELKIEYVPVKSLKPYEKNAKLHPDKQIEQIKNSIKQFGMNDPIAVWKDNVIIEGHGRFLACLSLNIDIIPIIRLDALTDEQRRAYGIVHNKLTMNTGFDLEILEQNLEKITDIDMKQYDFEDIDNIQEQLTDFFTPSEKEYSEQSQQEIKDDSIQFTIMVTQEKIDDLLSFLDQENIIYER